VINIFIVSHKFGSSDNVISRIEYKFVFKKIVMELCYIKVTQKSCWSSSTHPECFIGRADLEAIFI